MNKTSIKSQLRKYSIFQKRSTTINHAFASAMAPFDEYAEKKIDAILNELECFRNGKIYCVYCGKVEAQTWDHLFALVKNNEPSGYGHRYGNLVPSCKECNSKKGNKDWAIANELINVNNPKQKSKVKRVISYHIKKYPPNGKLVSDDQKKKLSVIKNKIHKLMKDADNVLNGK
ncbi:MAG: HNH endonuclease [Ignavibacteriales bacterium]|nr:HNH endonuclease [Ignavibacteriales bacterium]